MLITRFVEGIFDRTYGYGRGGENYAQDRGKRTCHEGSGTLRLQGVSTGYHLPFAFCQRWGEGPESMATRGEALGGHPRRGQSVTESATLLQIPLCVTAGPPEEGDPSLHWPALVDPVHNLDWREDPKGARPKVGPRFSTQTIAEEAQGFQGGTDFYLPLIGQPRISEVRTWTAPVCTEQGNPRIYIQADEWQETYGGNVFVVDEVTG